MRIVSLLPAATEICYALGLGEDLVGVSPECDHPAAARTKRIVSRSLLQYEGKSSGETSRMVGERLASSGALYQVDAQALRSTEPDLILTQGLCEVCAPTLGDVEDIARNLPRPPEIVSLDPHHLADVLENIEQIGRACDIEERAETVVEGLQQRIECVARKAALAAERPRTACLEWLDPLFIGGHWVPEMIGLAGGVDALGRPGEKSRPSRRRKSQRPCPRWRSSCRVGSTSIALGQRRRRWPEHRGGRTCPRPETNGCGSSMVRAFSIGRVRGS